MPDPIARKRLKKKMLDRWENEGGRVAADPAADDGIGPASEHKANQRSASRENWTAERPSKKRKATRK